MPQVIDNADAGSSTGSDATFAVGDRCIQPHVAESVFGLVRRALDKERFCEIWIGFTAF